MAAQKLFEGKNVDQAVQNACEALSIPKDRLNYEIISHGSTGIFGLVGVKKAKIKVFLSKSDSENRAAENVTGDIFSENSKVVSTAENEEQPLEISNKNHDQREEERFDASESAAIGLEVLTNIVDTITDGAQVTVDQNRKRIQLNVNGGNAALLIGKRGQTLDSIQYIVEKIVNKKAGCRVRLQVDVEGYLENRRANLQELALRMAKKTKKTGKPTTIGQMNAYDRRIVHLALKHDRKVRTQSKGDGYLRKLVIFPNRNTNRRKKGA